MSEFLRVGTFCYNLAHVRQIFQEPEQLDGDGNVTNPNTWNVFYEMGTDPRTGAGIINGQVFTGPEAEALKFWVENNIPDTLEIYKLAKEPRQQKPLGNRKHWDNREKTLAD